jgi:hypothetical protein
VVDPNLKAPVTTSLVGGVDRELVRNLGLQVSYSYTRTTNNNGNFSWYYQPWVGLTAADYRPGAVLSGTLPDGDTYRIPTWLPDEAKIEENGNSRMLTNWPGYVSYYHGVEVSLVKRMSNRWMARVGFALNRARESYGDAPVNHLGNPTRLDTSPLVNGGAFVVQSGGSGNGEIFMHSVWQLNANGVYQAPYGIELGASVFGRQGYPFAFYQNADLGYDGDNTVLVTPLVDSYRLANLWDTDIRVARTFSFGRLKVQAIADLFNLFNANTELVRDRNVDSEGFRQLAQNLSPRILRVGMRVTF